MLFKNREQPLYASIDSLTMRTKKTNSQSYCIPSTRCFYACVQSNKRKNSVCLLCVRDAN